MCVLLCLTHFPGVMSSKFAHVAACVRNPFFFYGGTMPHGTGRPLFFIHLSVDGQFDYFRLLATVNKDVQAPAGASVSCLLVNTWPRQGWVAWRPVFTFLSARLFSAAATVSCSQQQYAKVPAPHSCPHSRCLKKNDSHPSCAK